MADGSGGALARWALARLNALRADVLARLVGVPERYPDPPAALSGKQLREAAEDYGLLGLALEHLLDLREAAAAAERLLDAEPGDTDARAIIADAGFFDGLRIIASKALVPRLARSAVARGLDPEPFFVASEHLTRESRAKALALADRLALLADADDAAPGSGTDADYRPASAFPKPMRARLRVAAQPTRRTKRVRSTRVNGVVLYSAADARRWWPNESPRA